MEKAEPCARARPSHLLADNPGAVYMSLFTRIMSFLGWCPSKKSASTFRIKRFSIKKPTNLKGVSIIAVSGLVIVAYLSAYFLLAEKPRPPSRFVYIDDISIAIDDKEIFNEEFTDNNLQQTNLVNNTHVHIVNDVYHSPPYGLALECNNRHSGKNEFGIVDLTKTIVEGWAKVNVTFFIRIPEDQWLDKEERDEFSISFFERKDSDLECSTFQKSTIFIHGNGTTIHRTQIVYYGLDSTEVYTNHTSIELGSYGWHRLEFVIDKPSLIVLFDDNIVCEASVVQDYFTDMMVFSWHTNYARVY